MTSKVQAEKAIKISKGNISKFIRQKNIKNDLEGVPTVLLQKMTFCDMNTLEISFRLQEKYGKCIQTLKIRK